MKIEIDLNEILSDEDYGSETLQESVRRQVVTKLADQIKKGIGDRIDRDVSEVISETLSSSVKELMPNLINDLMSAEYCPITNWGDRGEPTTFRKQLVKVIHEQMVYKKTSYSSDKNAFTVAVDGVISENIAIFKKDFDKLVNEAFTKECLEYAKKSLSEKLGLKA